MPVPGPFGARVPYQLDNNGGTILDSGTVAGPTTYNLALSGALSFVGADPLFAMQRALAAAALSFTGSTKKIPARLLAGSLSFTGSTILVAITRLLAAGFTPTGTLKRAGSRVLAGALSFVGSAPLAAITRALSGALSFSGSLKRSTSRKLLASITTTGALAGARTFLRTITGSLSFIGGTNLYPDPALYPDPLLYPYGGAILFKLNRTLSAAFNPNGTLASRTATAMTMTLQAALSFLGGANLYPDPALYPESGLFPYGGVILFQLNRILPGSLQFTGAMHTNPASSLSFPAVFQPQVVFLKTSARVFLSAEFISVAFSAQKISNTVAKALFASLRNAGALSSIHNPGSAEHGGGGWGVPMPDSYFQRYKPTLRRQRMKV